MSILVIGQLLSFTFLYNILAVVFLVNMEIVSKLVYFVEADLHAVFW